MKAIKLRTDYLTAPLGLGNPNPRFYWNCEGGISQTAYRIICTREGETVWDSGKVNSSSMTHIRYEGKPLSSRDIINWSVTLWDEGDDPGETAESRFEMGLLEDSDWKANWISGDYKPKKGSRYPVDCFRRKFKVRTDIKRARLYCTARGVYSVAINGERIEDFILAPGATDYRKRIQYQTYDVAAFLREENSLELRLADGWFRGSVAAYGVTNVFGDTTSVMAQLEITHTDGSVETVITDGSFEWSNDGPVRFADLKDGEIYDALLKPSYSGRARVVPAPKAEIRASDNVSVTEHERLKPVLLTADDGTRVLDFGRNIAGYLEFKVKGNKGDKIKITCGETLGSDGKVDMSGIRETRPAKGWSSLSLMKKLLGMPLKGDVTVTPKQQIIFTCSGGDDVYKSAFTVFGFRFAQIETDIAINPEDFTAIAVYSDMDITGSFSCSDERINKLAMNTLWSMKGNFLDIPTDCPTRERLGWTGDAQIFFDTGAFFMDTAAFFKKWLRDMEDSQYKDGLIPAVIPYNGIEMMYKPSGQSVGWADAVYLIPWRFYLRFGDEEILRQYWPMMKLYGDFLLKNSEKDGHYEKGVHLGEWLEPEEFRETKYGPGMKHPEECTAYLFLAMTTLSKIARILGENDCVSKYEAAAKKAKEVYPLYADLDTDRQAKLVRPLALGLLEGDLKKKTEERLKKAAENANFHVTTGFLSTPFLLPVLTAAGETGTAYKMLENEEKPGWLYEVSKGATTIWESWEGDASLNHYSPGSVCAWLFDTVCGINVSGENHFMIRPVPGGGLAYARALYDSPYGRVESRWEKDGDKYSYEISVPSGTSAEIILPDGRNETVSAGKHIY